MNKKMTADWRRDCLMEALQGEVAVVEFSSDQIFRLVGLGLYGKAAKPRDMLGEDLRRLVTEKRLVLRAGEPKTWRLQ